MGIPATDDLSNNEIDLAWSNSSMNFVPYGAQPPILNQARVLKLVNDSNYPQRGPAWFFQTPYNKLVVLPEAVLSPSAGKRSTINYGRDSESTSRKGIAQPGERPWFCYWNGTLLEAFIYVNQTSIAGSQSLSMSSATATATTGAYNQAQSATSTYASSVPTGGVQSNSYSSGPTADPSWPQLYPKVLKIEERRVPIGDQNISPYCIQNYVNADGTYQPILNSTNQPVTIFLNETEPTTVEPLTSKRTLFASLEERGGDLFERQSSSTCGCVWLAQ